MCEKSTAMTEIGCVEVRRQRNFMSSVSANMEGDEKGGKRGGEGVGGR